MDREEKSFQNRSMIYEIENEENPYRKEARMKKWYAFLVKTTLKKMPTLKEQLDLVQMDTVYMLKHLPTEEDFEEFVNKANSREGRV